MAQNITLLGASYSDVPAVTLPKTGGGTAQFDDTTDATATASDIMSGKTAYVNGSLITGTASSSNDYIITLSRNSSGTWSPDCTYAEAYAAYSAGKTIETHATYNGMTYPSYISYSASQSRFYYAIQEQFNDFSLNAGYTEKGYFFTSSGTSLVTNQDYYLTSSADAATSDVASGKVFYTSSGGAVGTSTAIVPSGNKNITANGTGIDVAQYATVSVNVPTGGGLNVQAYHGMDYVRATSYTATDVTLTVEVTGTYTVSWMGFRNTTSSTSGSQLYINGSAYGTAHTTFTSSYGQSVIENNVQLDAGDVLVVRARARSTSYYMYVGQLVIEQIS